MDPHKRAMLAAWAEHPTPFYTGSVIDHLQGRPVRILGGKRVETQVRKLLTRELRLVRLELEAASERQRGRAWWARYIEGPVDDELQETLTASVPRRKGESADDYLKRLKLIEAAMRARLPSFEVSPEGAP